MITHLATWDGFTKLYIFNSSGSGLIMVAWYHSDPKTVMFSDLYVDDKYRGTGVAKLLIIEAINQSKKLGAEQVRIFCTKTWHMDWYSTFGFIREEEDKNEEEAWMTLLLN